MKKKYTFVKKKSREYSHIYADVYSELFELFRASDPKCFQMFPDFKLPRSHFHVPTSYFVLRPSSFTQDFVIHILDSGDHQ